MSDDNEIFRPRFRIDVRGPSADMVALLPGILERQGAKIIDLTARRRAVLEDEASWILADAFRSAVELIGRPATVAMLEETVAAELEQLYRG